MKRRGSWAGGYGYGLEGANQVNGVALVEKRGGLEVFVVEPVVDIFFKIKAEFGSGRCHLEAASAQISGFGGPEIAERRSLWEVRCNDFWCGRPNGETGLSVWCHTL